MAEPSAGQPERFFVIGEHSGQIVGRDFLAHEAGAVNRIEQKLHLMNTLGYLAGASMREGLVTAGVEALADRYGEEPSRVVQGAERKRVELIHQSRIAFAHGTGHYALIDSGVATSIEARRLTRSLYSDFLKKYYGVRHHKDNFQLRKQLAEEAQALAGLPNVDAAVTAFNRENQLRPHDQVASTKEPVFQKLANRERLEPILFDPRAGFLPATNREKNLVITFLDYLDNPHHPLGINNQLFEVLSHAQKANGAGAKEGARALESIAWEIGDYLADAVRAHKVLSQLKEDTADFGPGYFVAEDVADHVGIPYLLSYMNRVEWMEEGKVRGLNRDPLRTAEERWTRSGPGKHKTVHSPYTRPDRGPVFDKYFRRKLWEMTYADLRECIDEAIGNEKPRAIFMTKRLEEMDSFIGYPSNVRHAVRTSLDRVQDDLRLQLISDGHLEQVA